jgi:nicotinate-nucleotide adenylyltransferase
MKTGILGGTFNPVHLAHLQIAEEVQRACHLDRVLFIPAAAPPHKDVAGEVTFEHRLAMVEIAVRNHPRFHASDMEQRRGGKSFSVDTLDILLRNDPSGERYFIIGLDSYRDIASWKDYARIFDLCHLVVVPRPGLVLSGPLEPLPVAMHKEFCYDKNTEKVQHKSGNYLIFLSGINMDISSSMVRRLHAEGHSIRHLVPPGVADYIQEHRLYCAVPL